MSAETKTKCSFVFIAILLFLVSNSASSQNCDSVEFEHEGKNFFLTEIFETDLENGIFRMRFSSTSKYKNSIELSYFITSSKVETKVEKMSNIALKQYTFDCTTPSKIDRVRDTLVVVWEVDRQLDKGI